MGEVVQALPHESRAAREASIRAARRGAQMLLGEKDEDVPEPIHVAMCALATDGFIPIATIERCQVMKRGAAISTVPDLFKDAAKYCYVHPALQKPQGYRWVRQPAPLQWKLLAEWC